MVTTPLAQLSVSMPRALWSMMPTSAHVAHADAQVAEVYPATPAAATAPSTTTVVNPWLGGGTCGLEFNPGSTNGTPNVGFATKRIRPGRLEGST